MLSFFHDIDIFSDLSWEAILKETTVGSFALNLTATILLYILGLVVNGSLSLYGGPLPIYIYEGFHHPIRVCRLGDTNSKSERTR